MDTPILIKYGRDAWDSCFISAPWLWQYDNKASLDTLRLWLSIKQGKVKTEGLVMARGETNIVSMQGKHTTYDTTRLGQNSSVEFWDVKEALRWGFKWNFDFSKFSYF